MTTELLCALPDSAWSTGVTAQNVMTVNGVAQWPAGRRKSVRAKSPVPLLPSCRLPSYDDPSSNWHHQDEDPIKINFLHEHIHYDDNTYFLTDSKAFFELISRNILVYCYKVDEEQSWSPWAVPVLVPSLLPSLWVWALP